MKKFIAFIWQSHRYLSIALIAALIALAFFLSSFVRDAVYFAYPANQDRALELWMSPRYVGQSWDLPKDVIFDIMQMDERVAREHNPRTVDGVLQRTGMTLPELQSRVQQAQADLRERPRP